jgi:tetratricopeptide (TPR) repeat protein
MTVRGIIFILMTYLLLLNSACQESLPEKSSNEYRTAISAFYVGLAALQVGYDIQAKNKLTEATKLADGEPAAWANLGILQIRQRDFDGAEKSLEKARSIVPDDGKVYELLALLETQRGAFDKAVSHWQKAIELNPKNFKAVYALAQEKERQTDDAAAQQLYEKILASNPNNLAAQLEVARLAAKRNDVEVLKKTVAQISVRANAWSNEIKEQFDALQKAVNENNLKQAAVQVAFLRNVLLRLPEFRNDLSLIKPSDTVIGEPFLKPLKLPAPDFAPAPPDEVLTFDREQIRDVKATWAKSIAKVGLVWANKEEITIGTNVFTFLIKTFSPDGVVGFDFDYDFRTDIAIVGKGFHLLKQDVMESFVDVTPQTKLPSEILSKSYFGAWVLDVELDGDLDLILGSMEGVPVVLRNNADGTFKEVKAFQSVNQLRDFVWADLDEDGDADAITLDANGRVQFFSNERGGQFREKDLKINNTVAVAVADVNGDSVLDLIALHSDGALLSLNENFEAKEILLASKDNSIWQTADSKIIVADFDNNGGNDILISSAKESRLWLGDKDAKFKELNSPINARVFSTDDFNDDGKLDLVALDAEGKPNRFINRGTKNYSWQTVRPKGAKITGDQRINSFGIGSEIELRAGLLTQKQVINSPIAHFGLGEQTKADLMRIVWSNGIVQAEFDFAANQSIAAEQRVKGSCPHLYAWNGERFQFVKDAPPWGTVLGVKLNEKDFLPIRRNEEWIRIRGDKIKERDGFYEFRVTDELGETYYVDNYSLIVIDHPIETEVFVDERYADPPVELTPRLMTTTKSFSSAKDEKGNDVSDIVRSVDENYLGGFERGNYQGLVKEHFVELELPDEVPRDEKLFLVADGWVNLIEGAGYVALSQGDLEQPQSLSLEVADGHGGWKVVQTNLGTPAGVYKTILLDLTDAFVKNAPRRLRLKTNLEIYWDRLGWAVVLPSENIKRERLNLSSAELRYRGFSVMAKANESAPTVPNYESIASTSPQWRDLEGYYTRFGDVRELLLDADERFAIVNAGDEMVLRFAALPLRKDWIRDFIFIGHGWLKDSDATTLFSQTVTPLPQTGKMDYAKKSPRLEDDPVYKKHKEDWLRFHTRYVSHDDFKLGARAARPQTSAQRE